ncbi:MAG: tol-pal system-associated acyl-CoA thioesterase [Gammaproteobacteria bacterium]|nr:tol-pal system-associated acyl-CoA thioesterase [Gammaproteobacteria bacterium]
MHEFRLAIRVYYEDTDAAGIVYHANYLKYMERARTEWLRGIGFEQDDLARRFGIAFVVRDAELEFLRAARFNDEVMSICRITRIGRATVEFAQSVVAGDTVLCLGQIRVGCVDFRAMAAKRIPQEIYMRIKDEC